MTDVFLALLAGAIQGLTEFLPVSSSGHLVLFHDFLNFEFPSNLAFDVVLHVGTLLALVVYFFSDLWRYAKAFVASFFNWNIANDKNQLLAWYLFTATIPAAVSGYFLKDIIESYFRNSIVVALMLIVFGIALYLADYLFEKTKTISDLSWAGALIIGVAQVLALVPGVSRSGITIIAGLSQKLHRADAARFSFLLSVPIIFGAGVKQLSELIGSAALSASDYMTLTAGFLAALVSSYIVVKYFLRFLQNHSFKVFAYYRVALGLVILTFALFTF